ncbi:hypothetical protein llap_5080 [Limosa lapponica baueri]|uniref:Uncharacterized protein n=1 Tax=Limosa lapponica baueri TaxID=1758121 RepID=A0A2I0UF25_LIMLA|nr:hypothetical protein llap_5080 [Limosa lapponica baueri]
MPDGSKTDPQLAKAEPINNSGSTSGITHLKKRKNPVQAKPKRDNLGKFSSLLFRLLYELIMAECILKPSRNSISNIKLRMTETNDISNIGLVPDEI